MQKKISRFIDNYLIPRLEAKFQAMLLSFIPIEQWEISYEVSIPGTQMRVDYQICYKVMQFQQSIQMCVVIELK